MPAVLPSHDSPPRPNPDSSQPKKIHHHLELYHQTSSPTFSHDRTTANMHLMYTLSPSGERIYTLKKVAGSEVTKSAHPARFSPDDKYSRHRVTLKKRYGLLLTQIGTSHRL